MSGQQQNDSGNDALYVGGFLLLLVVVAQLVFGEQIAAVHLWMRELWLNGPGAFIHTKGFESMRHDLDTYKAREWLAKPGQISQVSKQLRWLMFIPLASILGYYAYRVWTKNPGKKLRRVMDREALIKSEVALWPFIAPVEGLDLVNMPIDSGKWAMAKLPIEFARKRRLLDGREVNKLRTEKLFASQLGRLWEGPDKLPRHVQALYACFIAQACRDKDAAFKAMQRLALTTAAGKPDYAFVPAMLAKHRNDPRITHLGEKHAYVTTVLCAALEAARSNGVLAPAYFVWLRPLNRDLWYALNGVGRRTPVCETAGVHGHFLAEKVAGHKIERPYVTEAVKALERSLREYKFD